VFRFCWRFARTGVVCLALFIAAFFIHLHNVGLPETVKQRLVQSLERRGWHMEYSRLRFRWMQGIVGEDLHLRPSGSGARGPELFVDRIDFRLSREDLRRFVFTPESLLLRQGRCVWVLTSSNETTRSLTLEKVEGKLRYAEPDRLELSSLTARFHGLDVSIEAHLTNITHLREIRWPQRRQTSPSGVSTEQALRDVAESLDRCQLSPGSSLSLRLLGDLQQTNSFQAELDFKLPSLTSPWLTGTNVELWSKILPPVNMSQPFELKWRLSGEGCRTPWGEANDLRLEGNWAHRLDEPLARSGEVALVCSRLRTRTLSLDGIQGQLRFERPSNSLDRFAVTLRSSGQQVAWPGGSTGEPMVEGRLMVDAAGWTPLSGEITLSGLQARLNSASAQRVRAKAEFTNPLTNVIWNRAEDANGVAIWRLRQPFLGSLAVPEAKWELSLGRVEVPKLSVEEMELQGGWRFPDISISRLHGVLNRGEIDAALSLNVSNRLVSVSLTNTTDAHLLGPLLGTNATRWLSQYGWKQPPWVRADAEIRLPQWSHFLNRLDPTSNLALGPIPWKEESVPSLRVSGQMRVGEGDFRKAEFSSATMSFFSSNQVWWLPNIVAIRPEGTLELAHFSDEVTKDYSFRIRSQIDPKAIKPILASSAHDELDLFQFGEPPLIQGEVRGRWRSPELLSVLASFQATNMSFRGESAKGVQVGTLNYTNRLFIARDLSMDREEGKATVAEAWFDLDEQKLRLSNVVSRVHLAPVCRAIGPKVAEVMEEYRFQAPPFVKMNGVVDTLKRRNENDLHFDVDASLFSWKLFHLPQVVTRLDWVGDRLDLTQLRGRFYGGQIRGGAHFDFSRDRGTDFRFDLNAQGVFLSQLMKDVSSKSNRVEGVLDCEVVITNANTRDKFTWNGYGRGELTNGLIWDIPFFALVSPVLNTVSSGLGNSRARHATGSFGITNGTIFTQDLEIRANAMRLKAGGTVDFDKRLNARMEAELLRNMPAVGFVLSKLFWPVSKLFEFKITGTLDQPKTDQLYMIPRILLAPLHPVRTLKDLFQGPGDAKRGDRKAVEENSEGNSSPE
jgi:hypothetical protein